MDFQFMCQDSTDMSAQRISKDLSWDACMIVVTEVKG